MSKAKKPAAPSPSPSQPVSPLAVLRFHVETSEQTVLAQASDVARHLRECADKLDGMVARKDVYGLSASSAYLFGPDDVPALRARAAIVDGKRRVLDLLDGKKDVHL